MQDRFSVGFDESGSFLDLAGYYTVYSDLLDNGGFDLMATFPSLIDPSMYFVAAEIPDGTGGLATAYLGLIPSIYPTPISEPGTLLLLLSGFLFLSRRKQSILNFKNCTVN